MCAFHANSGRVNGEAVIIDKTVETRRLLSERCRELAIHQLKRITSLISVRPGFLLVFVRVRRNSFKTFFGFTLLWAEDNVSDLLDTVRNVLRPTIGRLRHSDTPCR